MLGTNCLGTTMKLAPFDIVHEREREGESFLRKQTPSTEFPVEKWYIVVRRRRRACDFEI